MATTMLPPPALLPDVLPTERLTATGRPVPEVRAELRRVPNVANVFTVFGVWFQAALTVGLGIWLHHPLGWALAFVLMGRTFARLGILGHEAAHRLLFSKKSVNDTVGKWLCSYPSFTPLEAYRRSHMAHHKQEFGPEEPDIPLYRGYPVPADSFRRKLWRDATFRTGWKIRKPFLQLVWQRNPIALQILAVQVVLLGVFTAIGRPELYVFMWLLPEMSVWRVLNRLRAVAEHGGMKMSEDRRETTHHVRQSLLARFWIVPYNTGWHLAHHVDIGIPWRKLPQLHRELVASGWIVPELEYPSYVALWRKLASGEPRLTRTPAPATTGTSPASPS
jgi:fatty acid desaturase